MATPTTGIRKSGVKARSKKTPQPSEGDDIKDEKPQMTSVGSHPPVNPQGTAPQDGVQQPQQVPGNIVLSAGPTQFYNATPLVVLGEMPSPADCPMCRHRAMTLTTSQTGNRTHLWALCVCLFTGLGCIPYLLSGTKDIRHNCGHCGTLLATWLRGGGTVVHAFGG